MTHENLRVGMLIFPGEAGKPTLTVNVPFDPAVSAEALGCHVGCFLHARGHRHVALDVLRAATRVGQALLDGCKS